MQPPSLQQGLTQVISDMLARNRSYFGAGGSGYYGVRVDNLASDGAEFDLNLTFKSGVRYCCIEHGCHVPLYGSSRNDAGWFKEMRVRLKEAGIENVPRMTIKRLHVVVEAGAMSDGLRHDPCLHESRLEYDLGPFHEIGEAEEKPTRT
jgi:hypothetical protein